MNNFTSTQVRHLTWVVRGVLVFGIVTSIAANVIHSLTQPHAQTWQVWTSGSLSAIAPLVLFACTEMVTRIPVHSRVLGPLRLGVTTLIAGFAAWVSYWHMVSVAKMLGESGEAPYLYPALVDGMMLVATISLIELGRFGTVVHSVEVAAAVAAQVEETEARRCKPGCTCGRHNRKPTTVKASNRRKRNVAKNAKALVDAVDKAVPSDAPVSPAPAVPSPTQLDDVVTVNVR